MSRQVPRHPRGPPGRHEGSARRLSNAEDFAIMRNKSLAHDRHGKMDSDFDDERVGRQQGNHPPHSMNLNERSMHGSSYGGKEARSPLARDRHGNMDSDFDDERVGGQQDDYPARSMNPDRRSMHGSSYGGKESRSRDMGAIMDDMKLHGHQARAPIPGGAHEGRGSGFRTKLEPMDTEYGDDRGNPYLSREEGGEEFKHLADLDRMKGWIDEMREKLRAVADTGDGEAIAICKGRLGVLNGDMWELLGGKLKGGMKSREYYIYPDDGYDLKYPPSRPRRGRQGPGRYPGR